MKKIVFIAIFFVLFFIIGKTTAFACSCTLISDQKKRVKYWKKESAGIFVGTVRSVSQELEKIDGIHYRKIVLTVERSWKSAKQSEIIIYFNQSCFEFTLKVNKTYLIYAKKSDADHLITQICFGTHEFPPDDKDLKYLGKPDFINKK